MTVIRRICLAIGSCAVAGLTVTGCGTQTAGDGAGAGGAAGTPPLPTVSAPPSRTMPVPTKTLPPVPGAPVVVQGVIEPGVEPGCYVLTPDRGGSRYVVITTTPPPTGVPVTVRGIPHPDQASYCQQGTPLQASRIELR
jgi:hypothetical protein